MASPKAGSQLLATVAHVREAGCRNAGVEAQMVGGTGLLADTVGAVRQGDGGDVFARQRAGGRTPSRQKAGRISVLNSMFL